MGEKVKMSEKAEQYETYGAFIKRVRKEAHLTQEEFALWIGVDKSSVCAWENDKYLPSFASRMAIEDFAKSRE
jgi:DNA-binding XRE family transcriptional regulator